MKYTFNDFEKEIKDKVNTIYYFPEDNQVWINDILFHIEFTDEYFRIEFPKKFKDMIMNLSCFNNMICYLDTEELGYILKYDKNLRVPDDNYFIKKIRIPSNVLNLKDKIDLYLPELDVHSNNGIIFDNYIEGYHVKLTLLRDYTSWYYKIESNNFTVLSDISQKFNGQLLYGKGAKIICIIRGD